MIEFVLRHFIAKDFSFGDGQAVTIRPAVDCMLESLPFRDRVSAPRGPPGFIPAETNDLATKQISGATQQIPDTLPRPQMKGEPERVPM